MYHAEVFRSESIHLGCMEPHDGASVGGLVGAAQDGAASANAGRRARRVVLKNMMVVGSCLKRMWVANVLIVGLVCTKVSMSKIGSVEVWMNAGFYIALQSACCSASIDSHEVYAVPGAGTYISIIMRN